MQIKSILRFDETWKCAQQFNQPSARVYIYIYMWTKYIYSPIREDTREHLEERNVSCWIRRGDPALIDKRMDEDFRFRSRELIKTIDASDDDHRNLRVRVCKRHRGKRAVSSVPLSSAFLSGSWWNATCAVSPDDRSRGFTRFVKLNYADLSPRGLSPRWNKLYIQRSMVSRAFRDRKSRINSYLVIRARFEKY